MGHIFENPHVYAENMQCEMGEFRMNNDWNVQK